MEAPKAPAGQKLTSTMVWLALFQAPFLYLAVAYFARKNNPSAAAMADAALGTMVTVFGVMSAMQVAVIFLVLPKFRSKIGALPQQRLVYDLIRWALAEAVATYGLVIFFIGAPWSILLSFTSVSVALLLALRPKSE